MVLPGWLRIKNLVQINMWYKNDMSFSDRARFFKAYKNLNPGSEAKHKKLAIKVAEKTEKRMRKFESVRS